MNVDVESAWDALIRQRIVTATDDGRLVPTGDARAVVSGGGRLVPDSFIGDLNLDLAHGTAGGILVPFRFDPDVRLTWRERERRAIAAAHPKARLRRRIRAARWFLKYDVRSRLRNARAALAGDWERNDGDD